MAEQGKHQSRDVLGMFCGMETRTRLDWTEVEWVKEGKICPRMVHDNLSNIGMPGESLPEQD